MPALILSPSLTALVCSALLSGAPHPQANHLSPTLVLPLPVAADSTDSLIKAAEATDQAETRRNNSYVYSHLPVASPRDTSRATIGNAHVLVDYGRPSKRGRAIFGSLVPYDQVWRTGANMATTLVTDKPLTIGTVNVPAGSYTLYTIPSASGWQLIINKENGQWGLTYHPEFDLGRTAMTVSTAKAPVEKFSIDFPSGKLRMQWDTTVAEVPIAEQK
jgi:hypothetical protein